MQLFKFFQPYKKYIKTAKNDGFCEELLSENDFEAVLVNFSCYEYIIVPMLLRQCSETKISTSQGDCWVYVGFMPTH